METLIRDVANATGLDERVAKTAVGHVPGPAPRKQHRAFIDKNPAAHEAAQAAAATGDGGVTMVIEGLTSLRGQGRFDLNGLAGNLENLGLTAPQITRLVQQVMTRADALVGSAGAAKIREILPALAERLGPAAEAPARASSEAQAGPPPSTETSRQPEPRSPRE